MNLSKLKLPASVFMPVQLCADIQATFEPAFPVHLIDFHIPASLDFIHRSVF
jgi:hypothetical protein